MTKHQLTTGLGVVAILMSVAFVPAASADAPKPLVPAQAEALVSAPSLLTGSSVTRRVSPQEALAAASIPGASVSVASGMSPAQAVGIAPTAGPAASTSAAVKAIPAAESSAGCASTQSGWHWGTWPYDQQITDITYWCAIYGVMITYRSTSVTASGTLCGTAWTASQLISGGVGYTWFVTRASAGWNCPTVVPWVILHPSHYLDTSHNDWGNSAQVGTG